MLNQGACRRGPWARPVAVPVQHNDAPRMESRPRSEYADASWFRGLVRRPPRPDRRGTGTWCPTTRT